MQQMRQLAGLLVIQQVDMLEVDQTGEGLHGLEDQTQLVEEGRVGGVALESGQVVAQ